jgi:hypothetical protein
VDVEQHIVGTPAVAVDGAAIPPRPVRGWTRWWRGPASAPSTFALANHVALRALGAVYLIAFVSYWVQAEGLIGERGLLPFASWMKAIRPQVELLGYHHLPTLLWLHPSDLFLHVLFGLGTLGALLLMAGLVPLPATAALWLLYLSVTQVGRQFLSFQWDSLLLEIGLLAVLAAPWQWRLRWGRDDEPPRVAIWLMRWMAFRLMFFSGWVKLASQDQAWWDLSALTYHYWTQPLPTWTAWYMNLLPVWFQKFSCLVMFVIELGLPFLLVLPRRARHVAAGGFAVLMLLIILTGNYTYFNGLTLVLCCWLVDDRAWAALLRRPLPAALPPLAPRAQRMLLVVPALLVALLSTVIVLGALRVRVAWPGWVGSLYRSAAPFRSCNSYGLFAVMTRTRPEIVIEGSPDGRNWFEYDFKWKPGDLTRRPAFVAPHQPRLDWQMWFAALGRREENPWFTNLLLSLLRNEPAVLALLEHNPFPEKPPLAVRALRYEYRFTTRAERAVSGQWWRRESKDVYNPPLRLPPE